MWYVWTCLSYPVFILIALLSNFWSNMFEPIQYMLFTCDRICSRYVWFPLCWRSKKFHINLFLFFFISWACLWICSSASKGFFKIKLRRMHCNKNLTNDQLEAMFTATDEEIQQIEQLMKCLIKRTNHKWKRYTRSFSNKLVLKQHYCEPCINQEKCPHCGKTINHTNGLEEYLRSCEKAPTHSAKR